MDRLRLLLIRSLLCVLVTIPVHAGSPIQASRSPGEDASFRRLDSSSGHERKRGHDHEEEEDRRDDDRDDDDRARPPKAKLQTRNLTRDRHARNWIRLDARESEARHGARIAHYEYKVTVRQTGRPLLAPGRSSSRVAHVLLSPGRYRASVTVTDSRGKQRTKSRRFHIRGKAFPNFDREGIEWALGESWSPGDETMTIAVPRAPIELAQLEDIFTVKIGPSEGSDSVLNASSDGCGSVLTNTGTAIGMFSHFPVTSPVLGPLADGLKFAGGKKGSACTQNEINEINEQLAIQEQQIEQIQTSLDLIDNEFYDLFYTAEVWKTNGVLFDYNDNLTHLSGTFQNWMRDIGLRTTSTSGSVCPAWSSLKPGQPCNPAQNDSACGDPPDQTTCPSECGTAQCPQPQSTAVPPPTDPALIQSIFQRAINTGPDASDQADFQVQIEALGGAQYGTKHIGAEPLPSIGFPIAILKSDSALIYLFKSYAQQLNGQITAQANSITHSGFPATLCAASESDSCSCEGTVYYGKKYVNSLAPGNVSGAGSGVITTLGQLIADPAHTQQEVSSSIDCSNDAFGDPAPDFFKHCYCQPYPESTALPSNPNLIAAYDGYNATLVSHYRQSLLVLQKAFLMEYLVNVLNYLYAQSQADPPIDSFAGCQPFGPTQQLVSWSNAPGTLYDCTRTEPSEFTVEFAQRDAFNLAQLKLTAMYASLANRLYENTVSYIFTDVPISPQGYPAQDPLPGTRCTADYGAAVGDPVCCNQSGTETVASTATVCPSEYPTCIGYEPGGSWGSCVKEDRFNYGTAIGKAIPGATNATTLPDGSILPALARTPIGELEEISSGVTTTAPPVLCAASDYDTCYCDGDVYYGKKYLNSLGSGNYIGDGVTTSFEKMTSETTSFSVVTGVVGSIDCAPDSFGGDPAPDVYKHCYCMPDAGWTSNGILYQYGGIQDVRTCADAVHDYNAFLQQTGTTGALVDVFVSKSDDCPTECTTTCQSGLDDLDSGGTGLAPADNPLGGVCVDYCSSASSAEHPSTCGSLSYAGADAIDCTSCVSSSCPPIFQDADGQAVTRGYYDGLNLQPYSNIPLYDPWVCPSECYEGSAAPECSACDPPRIALGGSTPSNIFPSAEINPWIVTPDRLGDQDSAFTALCAPGAQQMGWYQPPGSHSENVAKLRSDRTYLMCGNSTAYDKTNRWNYFIKAHSNVSNGLDKGPGNTPLLLGGGDLAPYPSSLAVNMATCGHQPGGYGAVVSMDDWSCSIEVSGQEFVSYPTTGASTPCDDLGLRFQFGEIRHQDINGGQNDQIFFNLSLPSTVTGSNTQGPTLPLAMFGQCSDYNVCGVGIGDSPVSCLGLSAYADPPPGCDSTASPDMVEPCGYYAAQPTIPVNGYNCDASRSLGYLDCTFADGRTYSLNVDRTDNAKGTFVNYQTNTGCPETCFACQTGGSGGGTPVEPHGGWSVCEDFCSGFGYCGAVGIYSDTGSTNCEACAESSIPDGSWIDTCTPIRWDDTELCASCDPIQGDPLRSCVNCPSGIYTNTNGRLSCD